MNVNFERNGTTLRAIFLGELDQHSAKGVREELFLAVRQEAVSTLILDLRELLFMDSSGIGVFIGAYRAVADMGGKVEIYTKEGIIHKMIMMAGLSKLMEIRVGGDYE